MTIPLQTSAVYGPVRSRRFGASLGVNLLPGGQKVCNFDCVYCQYGSELSVAHPAFPTTREVVSDTAACLRKARLDHVPIDWIMIAGNGEPTLHPMFHEIIGALTALRDKVAPGLPIGILSNASTCRRPIIRAALAKLDGRFMKLDAGRPDAFCEINHPADARVWDETIEGLSLLREVTLQSMFVDGAAQNVSDDQVESWTEAVQRVRPAAVQIYTIDRPTANRGLLPAARRKLDAIADRLFEKTGIRGMVF